MTIFPQGANGTIEQHVRDPRFGVVRGDAKDIEPLTDAMKGHDVVIHLASNPDIARAANDPDIDFREGTYLTNNVVEAMRKSGTKAIWYASGSGVYGDLGEEEADEGHGPLLPISTYGASKLAGEVLITSYCHMFDFTGRVFRFGNVVGPRQTHGVGFDFLRQLLKNPRKLKILGDGTQSKSYIHVFDLAAEIRASFPGAEIMGLELSHTARAHPSTQRRGTRRRLIVKLLGLRGSGSGVRLLDIGSGQGDGSWRTYVSVRQAHRPSQAFSARRDRRPVGNRRGIERSSRGKPVFLFSTFTAAP